MMTVLLLQDWEGLLRICFQRKNKTLGAAFRFVLSCEESFSFVCICADHLNCFAAVDWASEKAPGL